MSMWWRKRTVRKRTRHVSSVHYRVHKEAARALVHERLWLFNQHYGLRYTAITIRNQRTRWGSCSSRGTLSFNYRIIFLPTALQDYVIVHELCHLQEFNHGSAFWGLVAQTIPNVPACRIALRTYSLSGTRTTPLSLFMAPSSRYTMNTP